MPIYQYRELFPDGSEGTPFNVLQSMSEEPLKIHPKTGNPLIKCFSTPSINSRYSDASSKKKLDPKNLEKMGFTQYQRDHQTGNYYKTAGDDPRAPQQLDPKL